MVLRPWLIRLTLALPLLMWVSVGHAAPPPLQPGQALDSGDAESYNVHFTLRTIAEQPKNASAIVLFARQADRFYALEFSRRNTTLFRCQAGKRQRLARAPGLLRDSDEAAVVIKRRPVRLSVEADREPLLEAWDGNYHQGEVCLASDPGSFEVADLFVQPIGPVAFTDDFLAEPNRESLWESAGGAWQIEAHRDPLTAKAGGPPGASWYAAQGQSALSLTGYDFWEDYALEVSALARADTWMGLAFFAADDDFTAFAVLPTPHEARAELFRVRRGQRAWLAHAPLSCPAELWHRLRVEATASTIRAFVNGQLVLTGPSEGVASGRVGLFASGPGKVHFDDFAAEGMDSFDDAFARKLSERWEPVHGRWQMARGKLVGSGSSDAVALVAGRTWGDASVSVTVKASSAPAGLTWRRQDEHNYYALLASGHTWRLVKKVEGIQTSLAEGRLSGPRAGDSLRLGVLGRGPQMIVRADGSEVGRAYDFAFREGRAGLLVRGQGKAAFDDFEVRRAPSDPATTISLMRCENERIPGPGHDESLPAFGYLWRRAAGAWGRRALDESNHALRAVARAGQQAVLTHRQIAPGSVMLSAKLPVAPQGNAGLAICTDGSDPDTGYALAVSATAAPSLQLLRRGKVAAELDALASEDLSWPSTAALFRDGPFVGAAIGEFGLTYVDREPLPDGHLIVWVREGQATFDDLRLASLRATVDRLDRPAPGWVPSHGRWQVHSGMACIPWDYWTTGFGEPLALTWRRPPCPPDFVLDFNVSEYSEGYEGGEHKHFPYHDISIALCGDGRDPDSGYCFLIATEGGKVAKLLREGEVAAQTGDPRCGIVMGEHCNSPRAFDVRVQKRGAHLSLILNGVPALQYEDPEPLPPGQIALGAADCAANFRDVVIYTWP